MQKVNGFCRVQVARCIQQFSRDRALVVPFARCYAPKDIRLLAEVDVLYDKVYGNARFERLVGISMGTYTICASTRRIRLNTAPSTKSARPKVALASTANLRRTVVPVICVSIVPINRIWTTSKAYTHKILSFRLMSGLENTSSASVKSIDTNECPLRVFSVKN